MELSNRNNKEQPAIITISEGGEVESPYNRDKLTSLFSSNLDSVSTIFSSTLSLSLSLSSDIISSDISSSSISDPPIIEDDESSISDPPDKFGAASFSSSYCFFNLSILILPLYEYTKLLFLMV